MNRWNRFARWREARREFCEILRKTSDGATTAKPKPARSKLLFERFMVETHEFKKVPIHSNTTIVIRPKLPCQGGASLVNDSRQQSIAPKAKPRTAWRVLCQVRARIVYAHVISSI